VLESDNFDDERAVKDEVKSGLQKTLVQPQDEMQTVLVRVVSISGIWY
jgi:hypothetical protein